MTADARPFLRTTRRRYDLILIDAYRQPYVPFSTMTNFYAYPGSVAAVPVVSTVLWNLDAAAVVR